MQKKLDINANPFDKSLFLNHRDWEDSLALFFVNEAKKFNVNHWFLLCNGDDTKKSVAFCALLLSDLLEAKPEYHVSSSKAFDVYKKLNTMGWSAKHFEAWLGSGWLNVSRIANRLELGLNRRY